MKDINKNENIIYYFCAERGRRNALAVPTPMKEPSDVSEQENEESEPSSEKKDKDDAECEKFNEKKEDEMEAKKENEKDSFEEKEKDSEESPEVVSKVYFASYYHVKFKFFNLGYISLNIIPLC